MFKRSISRTRLCSSSCQITSPLSSGSLTFTMSSIKRSISSSIGSSFTTTIPTCSMRSTIPMLLMLMTLCFSSSPLTSTSSIRFPSTTFLLSSNTFSFSTGTFSPTSLVRFLTRLTSSFISKLSSCTVPIGCSSRLVSSSPCSLSILISTQRSTVSLPLVISLISPRLVLQNTTDMFSTASSFSTFIFSMTLDSSTFSLSFSSLASLFPNIASPRFCVITLVPFSSSAFTSLTVCVGSSQPSIF